MSSKINGLNGTSPAVDAGGGAHRAPEASGRKGSGSSPSANPAGSDVHITASANMLAELAQQLQTLPAVDQARVTHFRAAIDNGSYTVHSAGVASQLMQIEQSLAQIHGD